MRITRLLLILSLFSVQQLVAQELNCRVDIIANQVSGAGQTADNRVYETLKTAVFEFMNNRRWTKDKFSIEERIDCSILITINERLSSDQFKGSIQVISRRPAYNSSYASPLLNMNDKDFEFRYLENSPVEFTPDQHRSNLAAVLAFYAYLIIGLDYDSYSLEGGTPYYVKAQAIVNNAQNAVQKGWKASEGIKNRYWYITNIQDRQFKPFRKFLYDYHRTGFDKMYTNLETSRGAIMRSLELLKQVHKARPMSFNVQLLFAAKANEIADLFAQAPPAEKSKVLNILQQIDPSNISLYESKLRK